jgi:hypothetical protein
MHPDVVPSAATFNNHIVTAPRHSRNSTQLANIPPRTNKTKTKTRTEQIRVTWCNVNVFPWAPSGLSSRQTLRGGREAVTFAYKLTWKPLRFSLTDPHHGASVCKPYIGWVHPVAHETMKWVQQSFVRNNVSACFIKHVYHNMFRLKSKPMI